MERRSFVRGALILAGTGLIGYLGYLGLRCALQWNGHCTGEDNPLAHNPVKSATTEVPVNNTEIANPFTGEIIPANRYVSAGGNIVYQAAYNPVSKKDDCLIVVNFPTQNVYNAYLTLRSTSNYDVYNATLYTSGRIIDFNASNISARAGVYDMPSLVCPDYDPGKLP